MIVPTVSPSRLLASLSEADARHPTERKLLVCRDHGEGRELLRALALRKGGWVGWEATTLRDLAGEVALAGLAGRGLRAVEEIEQAAFVDAALDQLVESRGPESGFAPLADGVGFRRALADSIEALRLAPMGPNRLLRSAPGEGTKLSELSEVLERYETELTRRRAADSAAVLAEALRAFQTELPLLRAAFFVVPGLGTRGLTGRLLKKLLEAGAAVLESDVVHGLDPPRGILASAARPERSPSRHASPRSSTGRADSTAQLDLLLLVGPDMQLDLPSPLERGAGTTHLLEARASAPGSVRPTCLSWLEAPDGIPPDVEPIGIGVFRAASPASEIREVLRRVLERGIGWDQVEIVASDPVTYGCALDVLGTQLGIEVTYAVGLPLERSRVGRALRTYLNWLEGGLHARPIWEAVGSGDLSPPSVGGSRPGRSGVVRELRRLRIGWGRERYEGALGRVRVGLASSPEPRLGGDEDVGADELAERRERRRKERASLAVLLERLLSSVPEEFVTRVGRPGDTARLSAASLASGALRFLGLFRARGEAEKEALRRVREVLSLVARVSTREASFSSAVAELRAHLAIRVPSPRTLGKQPWSSAAGKLHLTDLAHAGRSGRPFSFLVGMDVDRTAYGRFQDPILLDSDRRFLSPSDLPTTADRLEEGRHALAALLAGLRGEVTLSYAGWDASDGSVLSPAPVLLQLLRARERNPSLGFDTRAGGPPGLDEVLGSPVSPVPERDGAVDETDVLLRALSRGRVLADGTNLVRGVFPMLGAGLAADEARRGSVMTAHHGLVPAAGTLDPRDREDRAISASGLQMLAACPLAWFFRFGLEVREPEDPEYDPGRWLDPGERGTLLHTVFQRFGQAYREKQGEIGGAAAQEVLREIVEAELALALHDVPPPSAAALAVERQEILRSASVFLEMELRAPESAWEEFELTFGLGDFPSPAIELPGGRALRLRGRIDRVDRLPDGSLLVLDYKTGSPRWHTKSPDEPPFAGGRRIQAGIYARAVEALRGGPVRRFEYRFPTSRGEHETVSYERGELDRTGAIVGDLLDLVAAGRFLATDDPADCAFCDFRPVCRVAGKGEATTSPPAEWSRLHGPGLAEYETLRRLRRKG